MMRIAFDIQALQTSASRERGIGQYTYHFINNILKYNSNNDIILVANAKLEPPKLDVNLNYRLVKIVYPLENKELSEILVSLSLLAGDIDIYHITSPMELTEAVIPRCDREMPFKLVCTFYDLIPHLYSSRYLKDGFIREMYYRRLRNVKEADYIFAISESTRQDLIKHLEISAGRVSNIGTGVNPIFKSRLSSQKRSEWKQYFKSKYKNDGEFIFYTGGADWRKNMEGLISAFSKLPHNLLSFYKLVITCKLTPGEMQYYRGICLNNSIGERVTFTNYVSDEELTALYSLCSLFVFPSEYEGFGIPLAEAMSCGAPVIACKSSSLPEVVGEAGILVEPDSVDKLSSEIARVLPDTQLRTTMSSKSLERAKYFSWEVVAKKALNIYEELGKKELPSFNFKRRDNKIEDKPRIAFFTPLNPIRSGISDYSTELIPYLADQFSIDVFLDINVQPSDESILKYCHCYQHTDFEERAENGNYIAIIYQLGNSAYHGYMIEYILKYGGIITLHDYALGGLINWLSCEMPSKSPNHLDLAEELKYGYGKLRATYILKKMQSGKLWPHELINKGISLNKRFIDASIGLVVHSQWAFDMIVKTCPGYPKECLKVIQQGVPELPLPTQEEIRNIRQNLGLPENALIISSFGIIASTKRTISSIKAFSELTKVHNKAILLLVGECQPGYIEPLQLISKLNLENKVKKTGFVDFKTFYDYLKITDIALNLRFPNQGETSASLLRALSLGKATIVSNGGSFKELPEDVVMKVKYGPDDEEDLTKKLSSLASSGDLRYQMGNCARYYIKECHSLAKISNEYINFILRVVQNKIARMKLISDLTGKMLYQQGKTYDKTKAIDYFSQALLQLFKLGS